MINRVNITSPVGKGVFGGGIGGFLSGYTSSFVSTGMSNDWNLQESHRAGLDGAINGAFMGAMSGGVSSYRYANKNNINPWTGRPKKGIVIGRDMVNRVNPTAGNMGIETISNDWNNATQNDFNNDMLAGKQFNKEWLSVKIEEGYAVFDIGEGSYPIGTNYGMELRCLHGYTNIYPTHIIVLFRHISIIYYYGPTMY